MIKNDLLIKKSILILRIMNDLHPNVSDLSKRDSFLDVC